MAPLVLKPHPDSLMPAARQIEAVAALSPVGRLTLQFVVTGENKAIKFPARNAPSRKDELWRRTCFEAFLRLPRARGYYEFNFSPSTEWAAYRFSAYREDMSPVAEIAAPVIFTHAAARRFQLQASVDIGGLPMARERPAWKLGLAAVIEETDGVKSYWSLAHPPGKPDFHHRDAFVHVLNRESRS